MPHYPIRTVLLLTNVLFYTHVIFSSVSRPNTPTGVRVSDIAPHSIRVSWNDQPDADSFSVRYNSLNFIGGEQLGVCSSETHSGSVTTAGSGFRTTINVPRLRAFTTYSFTVIAINVTIGRSRPSNPPVVISTARTGGSQCTLDLKQAIIMALFSLQVPLYHQ